MSLTTQKLAELQAGLSGGQWIYYNGESFGVCDKYSCLTRLFINRVKRCMPFWFSTDPRYVLNELKHVNWTKHTSDDFECLFDLFDSATNKKFHQEIDEFKKSTLPDIHVQQEVENLAEWFKNLGKDLKRTVFQFRQSHRFQYIRYLSCAGQTYQLVLSLTNIELSDEQIRDRGIEISVEENYSKICSIRHSNQEKRMPLETVKALIKSAFLNIESQVSKKTFSIRKSARRVGSHR